MRSRSLRATAALAITALCALTPAVSAARQSRESKTLLWSALGGKVKCGIANHVAGGPLQILCESRVVPAPRHGDPTIGDPGYVYLKPSHGPQLARISQYSWQKGARHGGYPSPHATSLQSGTKWKFPGLAVTCAIRKRAVRCKNGVGHGFVIGPSSYRGF